MKLIIKIFLMIMLILPANCKGTDKKMDSNMEITGVISVKGSEPHTYLTIAVSSGTEYSITGVLKDEISKKYQNKTIKLKGKVIKEALGPGAPAQFEAYQIMQ